MTSLYLCQVSLDGEEWETLTSGTKAVAEAWRRQVAPRYRRRNHKTRVVTTNVPGR
jgi:hypothetical protein